MNDFNFLGVGGWFNVKTIPVISINRSSINEDDLYDDFFEDHSIKIASNQY